MDFLAPLFLAGAAAIALPIIFHLIRKTTHARTIFSSLMFLFPTPPKVTRRSRLDNILLLLLRCAVLCLLALGFARPYLVQPGAAGPPPAGKKVLVLLDTSASMRRDNLWPQARQRVSEVLQRLGPADELALLTFDDRTSPVLSLQEWRDTSPGERKAAMIARLEGITPSWRGTHLGNALLAAVDALETVARADGAASGETPREIIVVSDLQQGSHLEGLQGFEWPKGLSVSVEAVKARRPGNAGVHLVGERADAVETQQRVRVVNASDSKREQFKLTWVGGTNAPIETYVPAGQSRIIQLPPHSQRSGELRLIGDEEDFDNHLYWVGTRQTRVEVAYLGSEAETDTAQPLFYLKRAFQQTARQDVQITNRVTAAAALCIVGGESPADSRPRLRAGTVLLLMRSPASARIIADLLNLPPLACEEAVGQKYSLLADIDFTHPLFKPFADPRFSDFTRIHFWKHRKLDAQQIPGARVLARFDNGDPALLEVPPDGAREYGVLILTSGWHPADSQLALSSKFVPLLYSLLEASVTAPPERVQFEVAEKPPHVPGIHGESNMVYAINLAASESRTGPMALDELEQLGVPVKIGSGKFAAQHARAAQKFQATEAENQQKLWRWLILAALAFLAGETFLAGRVSSKQLVAQQSADTMPHA